MPAARTTALDAVALQRFLRSEGMDELEAMAVVLRSFSSATGAARRRPPGLILEQVCRYYDLTPAELVSTYQPLRARARKVAMHLLHTAGGLSHREAAQAVGRRNRSEAIRACRAVDADVELLAEAAAIGREIEAGERPVRAPVIFRGVKQCNRST